MWITIIMDTWASVGVKWQKWSGTLLPPLYNLHLHTEWIKLVYKNWARSCANLLRRNDMEGIYWPQKMVIKGDLSFPLLKYSKFLLYDCDGRGGATLKISFVFIFSHFNCIAVALWGRRLAHYVVDDEKKNGYSWNSHHYCLSLLHCWYNYYCDFSSFYNHICKFLLYEIARIHAVGWECMKYWYTKVNLIFFCNRNQKENATLRHTCGV